MHASARSSPPRAIFPQPFILRVCQFTAYCVRLLSSERRARICKCLRSPGNDSDESISTAYVAWRASTTTRAVIPARQAGKRFLSPLKGLQIRALIFLSIFQPGFLQIFRSSQNIFPFRTNQRPGQELNSGFFQAKHCNAKIRFIISEWIAQILQNFRFITFTFKLLFYKINRAQKLSFYQHPTVYLQYKSDKSGVKKANVLLATIERLL